MFYVKSRFQAVATYRIARVPLLGWPEQFMRSHSAPSSTHRGKKEVGDDFFYFRIRSAAAVAGALKRTRAQ